MHSETNQFSKREEEVINLLMEGKSNKQIALSLGISASTVEYHLKNIYKKLQANSRTEAILKLGKSIGSNIPRKLRESTVEINGESTDNGSKYISTRRIPMNKMFYIIGGCLLAIILVATITLTNTSTQITKIVPITKDRTVLSYTSTPRITRTDIPTLTPIVADTSLPPFRYAVTSDDTCQSIATDFNVSVDVIIALNNLPSACLLTDGQVLLIPYSNVSPSNPNQVSINPPAEFSGEWINIDLQASNMTRVSIQSMEGETYTYIDMFGACLPTDCDFRQYSPTPVVNYSYDATMGILNVKWSFDFQILTQELIFTPDGLLKITTQTHYLDNSGRADSQIVEFFSRQ